MIYFPHCRQGETRILPGDAFRGRGTPHVPPPGEPRPRLLYIHIPFCERLCPYCSFNRVAFTEDLCRAYFRALRKEITLYRDLGYDFGAIYVGGGTPTVLIDELEETIALARAAFHIRELSVETNPNHLTEDRLAILQRAGVNRLSVGVQSFDDGLLRKMDRYDKYGSGAEIAERLRQTLGRFGTLNADMIFNFPTQTSAMLDRDLDTLLEIGIDQVTWYPLMVSDSTRRKVMETLGRVDDRQEERFYHQIVGRLVPAYRFSSAWCFSRKQAMIDEYIVDYDEYAGLGSGSIGYLNGICYANTFDIRGYIAQIDRGELPLAASRIFSVRDQHPLRFSHETLRDPPERSGASQEVRREILASPLAGSPRLFPDRGAFLAAARDRPDEAGPLRLGGPDAGILHGGQQLPRLLPGASALITCPSLQ